MRRVVQKTEMACGIACVAMLAGVHYRKALEAFDDQESAETNGNYAPALRLALTRLGLRPSQRLKRFRGYDALKQNAILKVNPYNNGKDWHWVAWDASGKRILDPLEPPYQRYRPIAVITVE
jgi:ABC-type bacteriocin/lantibiotic exporter with double-glycine peptidase domain